MTSIFACLSLIVFAAPPADSVSPEEGVNRLRSMLLQERARRDVDSRAPATQPAR
jgi:hypothetical protein